ncbi:hypothetical protein T492DRAFT_839627 [Pavlovales sp. CCMP2436]|nr:hypothetical protein T492DRAFT_839627 [Pavlovales sp. CCMP2436]
MVPRSRPAQTSGTLILATLWGVSRKRMETLPQHPLAPPEMDIHSSGEADDTLRPTVLNLRNIQKQHIRHTLCRDAQYAADKKREDKLNDEIRSVYAQRPSYTQSHHQTGGYCNPRNRVYTQPPVHPPQEPPTGREWQNPEQ